MRRDQEFRVEARYRRYSSAIAKSPQTFSFSCRRHKIAPIVTGDYVSVTVKKNRRWQTIYAEDRGDISACRTNFYYFFLIRSDQDEVRTKVGSCSNNSTGLRGPEKSSGGLAKSSN